MSGERAPRILDVDIEALGASGDGVATVGRERLSIPFTIPGERVRVRLDRRRGRAVPTLLEIVRPSPHRVPPRCVHFGGRATAAETCGGCTWQHISYPEQLRLKRTLVDRLVREAVPGAPRTSPPMAASPDAPWGFRNKVHFVFAARGGREASRSLVMGHYARGSRLPGFTPPERTAASCAAWPCASAARRRSSWPRSSSRMTPTVGSARPRAGCWPSTRPPPPTSTCTPVTMGSCLETRRSDCRALHACASRWPAPRC